MFIKVDFFLSTVKFGKSLFKKFVRNLIILRLRLDDLLSRLVVGDLAGLCNDSDVIWGIHFFEHHLDLV